MVARGYLAAGVAILVLAFIDGELLTPGEFWLDRECHFHALINLLFTDEYLRWCPVAVGVGPGLIAIGALTGLVLLMAGAIVRRSARHA
jgi:hypothetical protein